MRLLELTIQHCRNIKKANLEFSPHVNLITGSNGSGKTSFIEALSVLGYGRSFRTSRISEVIQYEKKALLVSANINSDSTGDTRIGIEKQPHKTQIRVNRKRIKTQARLSKILPVTIVHPLSYQVITEGSSRRRRFIDWIAFYLYPEFHTLWKRYNHLLKQRNAALKHPDLHYAIEHLTTELCQLQEPIYNFRKAALAQFKHTLHETTPSFLYSYIPEVTLTTGFPSSQILEAESLIQFYERKKHLDKKRGRTTSGIHAADLTITLKSKPAATSASRGQNKIISLLLHVAQSLTIQPRGIIAIDDLSAEIDHSNYKKLLRFVNELERQLFITSTEPIDQTDTQAAMFHVEQGNFTRKR